MSNTSSRRNLVIVVLLLLVVPPLFLVRCNRTAKPEPIANSTVVPVSQTAAAVTVAEPVARGPDEILTAATVKAPTEVCAGAAFPVAWTGPNNADDYVTIVPKEASENVYANYRETREGGAFDLIAPIEAGAFEVRYVAARSKKVLGRTPITVLAAVATLNAPPKVILGSSFSVAWTGPDNKDDYITIVAQDIPDGKYGNFTYTNKGTPLFITAPSVDGDAELRYMTGQGGKVLARRAIKITVPEVSLSAPPTSIAGSMIEVAWKGPNNAGDYVTIVSVETRDGLYGNYANTSAGSPLKILVPIMAGDAELRYMTGQGAKVLARTPIKVTAANISFSHAAEAITGAPVIVRWTGPNNAGDYITIVPKNARDGHYDSYANTTTGASVTVAAPKEAGEAEVRYMSGQGSKVLARQPIMIVSTP